MRKKLLAVFFAMLMGLAGVACNGGDGEGRDGGDGVEIDGEVGEGGEGEGEGGDD